MTIEFWLILIGLLLCIVALVLALPFLGLGMIFPVFGDIGDIILSVIIAGVGLALILVGLGSLAISYWWVIVIAVFLYILVMMLKAASWKIKKLWR